MPRVVISGQAARRLTGGLSEFDVEANNFRRLVLELERRYPGLGHQVEEGMAVAIDGEIYQDAYLAAFRPDSEIYLIPRSGAAESSPSDGRLGARRITLMWHPTQNRGYRHCTEQFSREPGPLLPPTQGSSWCSNEHLKIALFVPYVPTRGRSYRIGSGNTSYFMHDKFTMPARQACAVILHPLNRAPQ